MASHLRAVQVVLLIIDWRAFLVFWLLPHLYAQWGIVTMNLLQQERAPVALGLFVAFQDEPG